MDEKKPSLFRNRYGELRLGVIPVAVVIIIIALLVGGSFITSVPAGYVGIQDTFGSVSDTVLQPGIHLKFPFTTIIPMSTRTEKYMDYGNSDVATITALSNEGLSVSMGIAVNYHINPDKAVALYKTVGREYQSVIMVNPIHSVPRDKISKYTAKTLYSALAEGSTDRAAIERELFEEIKLRINNMGVKDSIIVEDVFIRNIQLPAIVTTAIENVKKMEQESQQKDFEIQKQVKEAQRMREEAQGIADANKIIADSLSSSYLEWYTIEMMKEHTGATYFIPIDSNGRVNPNLVIPVGKAE